MLVQCPTQEGYLLTTMVVCGWSACSEVDVVSIMVSIVEEVETSEEEDEDDVSSVVERVDVGVVVVGGSDEGVEAIDTVSHQIYGQFMKHTTRRRRSRQRWRCRRVRLRWVVVKDRSWCETRHFG